MNKIILGLLILILGLNVYWTNRLVKFAKVTENFLRIMDMKTKCLEAKSGMDQNDIYLAAHGLTRENLKGKDKQMLPIRTVYDTENIDCKTYAEEICWSMDIKNPVNVEHCHDIFMTDKEYKAYKKSGGKWRPGDPT